MFRPKRTFLADHHPDLALDRQRKRAWKRMDTITIPIRDKGYWEAHRFITALERAFTKARIPKEMMVEIAMYVTDDGFTLWFRRFRTGFYSYIPWDEFIWVYSFTSCVTTRNF